MASPLTKTRRLFATLGTGLALLGTASGAALSTAPAAEAKAAGCVYYVKVFAYVRENPSPNSKILKSKGCLRAGHRPLSRTEWFHRRVHRCCQRRDRLDRQEQAALSVCSH